MGTSSQNPKRKSTSRTPSHHPVMGTNIPYLSAPLATAPSIRHRSEELASQIKRETDAERRIMVRRHTSGSLNVVTPCAACKLLRRRCAQECPFSPYFSPHEPQKFASVHKVFGASNVSKMLMEVPESQRADAANSLVYEANMRMRDPVYGCMGAISALQQQVQILEAELTAVREEILRLKYGQASATVLPTLLARAGGLVSVAAPPLLQVNGTALAPFSMASASSSSLYTPPPSASSTDYSSVTNDNVPYFG